jgi:S-adenosylmethionine:tRNA ribosyltransferase-isomerase
MSLPPLDYQLSSYQYDLPPELVAQRPVSPRDHSRLMVARSQDLKQTPLDVHFYDLPQHLPADCLLVVNQSRVYPARLWGQRPSGGRCEIFILSLVATEQGAYRCFLRSNGKKRVGDILTIEDVKATILNTNLDGTFDLVFDGPSIEEVINTYGNIPIPPYIRDGMADQHDVDDYQTLFAKELGSVAAPTAGLHFTDNVLKNLQAKNIETIAVSLHVGAGTFVPVKENDIRQHHMHSERFMLTRDVAKRLQAAWQSGRPVVAVGTTSLRVLESIYSELMADGEVWEQWRETAIFLHPGKQIKSVQGLITNLHLPQSSLLMLTSALMGRERMLDLYRLAVEKKYRFFSYGDAMLLWP